MPIMLSFGLYCLQTYCQKLHHIKKKNCNNLEAPVAVSHFSRIWWSCLLQVGKEKQSRGRTTCLFRHEIHEMIGCAYH